MAHLEHQLAAVLAAHPADEVRVLTTACPPWLGALLDAGIRIDTPAAALAGTPRRVRLCLALDLLAGGFEPSLARARDLLAATVLALECVGDSSRSEMDARYRALGFTPMLRDDDTGRSLYSYDIGTYKHTPDWLNARYWANPELYGKFRW